MIHKLRASFEKLGAWENFKNAVYRQYNTTLTKHLNQNFGNEKALPSEVLFQAIDWNKGGLYDYWRSIHQELKRMKL